MNYKNWAEINFTCPIIKALFIRAVEEQRNQKVDIIGISNAFVWVASKEKEKFWQKVSDAVNFNEYITFYHVAHLLPVEYDYRYARNIFNLSTEEALSNGNIKRDSKPVLIKGEYYYNKSDGIEWIHRYMDVSSIGSETIEVITGESIAINSERYYGHMGVWGTLKNFKKSLRPATPEERQWLNACAKAREFIPKEEALKQQHSSKSSKPKDYLPTNFVRAKASVGTVCCTPNKIYKCKIENGAYKWYSNNSSWDYYRNTTIAPNSSQERFYEIFEHVSEEEYLRQDGKLEESNNTLFKENLNPKDDLVILSKKSKLPKSLEVFNQDELILITNPKKKNRFITF